MDNNKIEILIRDINGKRETLQFENAVDFQNNFPIQDWNDEEIEILMVTFGNHCLYAGLGNETLYAEQLIGFFA